MLTNNKIVRAAPASELKNQSQLQTQEQTPHVKCSFCGVEPDTADKLVAGPSVLICASCSRLVAQVFEERGFSAGD